MRRRRVLLAGAAIAAAGPPRPALAKRALRLSILVGASPGNVPDRWARGFAPFLERHWPRSSVAIVNLPGEGGLVAARALAEAAPDGRTFGLISSPALIARCIERGQAPLLARLDPIAAVAEEPVVLVAGATGPQDLAALRALGERGLLGTPPPGGAAQLIAAQLGAALPLQRLAFPNGAAARSAVIGGNLAAALLPLSDALIGLREGKLVGLAIARARRLSLVGEIPTLVEQGLPAADLAYHRGLAAPVGVAQDALGALARSLAAAVADPEFAAQADAVGYLPRHLPRAEWAAVLATLTETLRARWEREPWIRREG